MKKSVMKKWVAALRSGKYKQGKEQLARNIRDEEGNELIEKEYCCLGVLAKVCKLDQELEDGFLNDTNAKKVGFIEEAGGDTNFKAMDFLADKNDTGKWGFKRIATYIEKNWKKL